MTGWKEWLGKKVFIISRNSNHPFQGKVIEVDDDNPPILFITIIDKFDKRVTFVKSEILSIKEEGDNG